MKRKDEHTMIFLVGIIIASGIALYRGADFDLFTIIGILIVVLGIIIYLISKFHA